MTAFSGILRVAVLLLMLLGTPMAVTAAPAAPGDMASSSLAKDKTEDEGDDDRGHGNDPDGVDEDNPGRGRGKKDTNNDPAAAPVEVTAQYRVDASCKAKGKDGDEISSCEFRAVAPEGAEKVTRVIVPEDAVCADVVGGDYEQAKVRAGEGLNGYASKPDKDKLTLELDGDVTTGGTATYWIVTGTGLFPAEGPTLECGGAVALDLQTSTPRPTSTPETGTLAVVVAASADVPADTSGFDWFGQCQPAGDGAEYRVTEVTDDGMQAWMATPDTEGTALFESLPPGEYRLETMGGPWCHAASNRVTAESAVVIEAGERTSVYVFLCEDTMGS